MKKYIILFLSAIFSSSALCAQDGQTLAKSDSLFIKGMDLYNAKRYHEAIPLFTESNRINIELGIVDNRQYVIKNLASCYYEVGNYPEAIQLTMTVLNIQEKWGKDNPDYAMTLNNLAGYNSAQGNYAEAIKFGTEALGIQRKIDVNHENYGLFLSNLALYYYLSGNYSEAIKLGTEAVGIREKLLGKNNPDYITSLDNLAKYYASQGNFLSKMKNYREAISFFVESERLYAELGSVKNQQDAKKNLASCYYELGNYSEAIQLTTKALNIQEAMWGKENSDYAMLLNNLAGYNSAQGNYAEAIKLGTEALRIQKRIDKSHKDYALFLSNLALYNYLLGNYPKAISLGTEALNIRENLFGKDSSEYALSLDNLSQYYASVGNISTAIKLGTEALNIRGKRFGKDSSDYAISLNNLAGSYSSLGNISEALKLNTEALKIREKLLGKDSPAYISSLHNSALYHDLLGNSNEAIRLATEALELREKTLGKEHPDYALSLNNLAVYSYNANSIDLMNKYANECTQLYTNIIQKTFANLVAAERNLFWKKYEPWFSKWISEFAYKFPSNALVTNAYNGTLLSKGLLLNSEIEMNKLLQGNGDKEIIEIYNDLQQNRQMLNKLYEKPVAERYVNTDSLERVVNRMERDLIQRSKAYGDYTQNLAIVWEDVQKKLGKKDIAVEFVSFPYNNDSTMYVAYILKSDMTTPQMVSLFEAKELAAIHYYKYYITPEVSKLVWRKLENYLNGCDNIYFAPAGELYNIAIESLPDYNGNGLISDRYNLYRLSSTRELAVTKDKNTLKEAVLYGGLKYDTDTKQMETDSRKYRKREMANFEPFNVADSLNLRSGASYLPATKIEAENINKSLTKTSIQSSLFTDTLGTEASFKDLSGKKMNLLHIATHGFYWNEHEAQQNDNMGFLMLGDDRMPRYVEDKALTRSGLLFSGANNALTGKALPEDVEDGILTAKEISVLDLRGLDLVVLSACQTGLGEITGDGVFGLQRGFKKAGANTLMMSLWKVDDNATQLLMSRFYENLIAGKGKYEALRDAQRYVREYEPEEDTEVNTNERSTSARRRQEAQNRQSQKTSKQEKPYQSPEYWAAFILLDAVN